MQGWAKRVFLRLCELAPVDRGSQEVGFTQPRDQYVAQPCRIWVIMFQSPLPTAYSSYSSMALRHTYIYMQEFKNARTEQRKGACQEEGSSFSLGTMQDVLSFHKLNKLTHNSLLEPRMHCTSCVCWWNSSITRQIYNV